MLKEFEKKCMGPPKKPVLTQSVRDPTGGSGDPLTVGFVNPSVGRGNQFAQSVRQSRSFWAELMTATDSYFSQILCAFASLSH
jgi:hypothetical protein